MDGDRKHENEFNESNEKFPAILPSRLSAFDGLIEAWATGLYHQATLTGESGSGKSWLWQTAAETARSLGYPIHWACISQLPGSRGLDLLSSIRLQLEGGWVDSTADASEVFSAIEKQAQALASDGFRLELVIEEAHHLRRDGFEVIRILQERLRMRKIEIGLLFVGQTILLQKYAIMGRQGPPAGWHLRPISRAETTNLMEWKRPERAWSRSEADWIHRETLGNPRRIVRWTEVWQPAQVVEPTSDAPIRKPDYPTPKSAGMPAGSYHLLQAEPLLPVKPPLEESEGLIEVGYDDPTWYGMSDENPPTAELSEQNTGHADDTETHDTSARQWRVRLDQGSPFSPSGLPKTAGQGSTEESEIEM